MRRRSRGKVDWIEVYGRTNARLHLLARTMHAEFVPPEAFTEFAHVRGLAGGCAFELGVVANDDQAPVLAVSMRHSETESTRTLDGEGLVPPALDLERLRTAVEATCYSFANH